MQKIRQAFEFIQKHSKSQPTVGITLGSGFADVAQAMQIESSFDFKSIPNFSPSTIEGHPGRLLLGFFADVPVAVLQGRIHFYEGNTMEETVLPTRVLGCLGIKTLILTNAAGGLLSEMENGDFMILEDHINMTGQNPLCGPNLDELGPRFPDMTEVYSRRLSKALEHSLQEQKARYHRGIYCGVSGPSYETPAEIRFFRQIGAGAVGMSTVAEAIAARHMGLEVVGLSCITNVAAGLKKAKILSHDDVKANAKAVEQLMTQVLASFIKKIDS